MDEDPFLDEKVEAMNEDRIQKRQSESTRRDQDAPMYAPDPDELCQECGQRKSFHAKVKGFRPEVVGGGPLSEFLILVCPSSTFTPFA